MPVTGAQHFLAGGMPLHYVLRMRLPLLFVSLLLFIPVAAPAVTSGEQGLARVHQCIMQNDAAFCHAILTPDSYPLFDRFVSYKLMPCLPTDFTYAGEEVAPGRTTVMTRLPAGGGKDYVVRLVFAVAPDGVKLDIPASFARGLGDKWEDKVQMSEQLYLLMRQNMGDKLTCDMLDSLVKPISN